MHDMKGITSESSMNIFMHLTSHAPPLSHRQGTKTDIICASNATMNETLKHYKKKITILSVQLGSVDHSPHQCSSFTEG